MNESTALVARPVNEVAAWTPTFAVAVDEMVARVQAKHDFLKRVMREGEHYGAIPGTKPKEGESEKKVLLKAGAELLLSSMALYVELDDAEPPVRDYDGSREGHGEALILYRRRARIYRQTGAGEGERMLIAQAEGYCTSRESKYRWRNQDRACPECGKNTIKVSKYDDGGFYCYGKIGGCGAKFRKGDPAIEEQATGRIPNPDVADLENTILKMADKRALVAASLLATGCSDIFTQDIGDEEPPADSPPVETGGLAAVVDPPAQQPLDRWTIISERLEALGYDEAARRKWFTEVTTQPPSRRGLEALDESAWQHLFDSVEAMSQGPTDDNLVAYAEVVIGSSKIAEEQAERLRDDVANITCTFPGCEKRFRTYQLKAKHIEDCHAAPETELPL